MKQERHECRNFVNDMTGIPILRARMTVIATVMGPDFGIWGQQTSGRRGEWV